MLVAAARKQITVKNVVLAAFALSLVRKLVGVVGRAAWIKFLLRANLRTGAYRLKCPTGSALLADALQRHGVGVVFAHDAGSDAMRAGLAALPSDIAVTVLGDGPAAVAAADAYYWATGKVGVVLVDAGPVLVDASAAIMRAQRSHSAVVVIAIESALLRTGRGERTDVDLEAAMSAHVTKVLRAPQMRSIVSSVEQAFSAATAAEQGVVVVGVITDLFFSEEEMRRTYGALLDGASMLLQYSFARLYATDAASVRPAVPLRPRRPASFAGPAMREATTRLGNAAAPLIFIGSQALFDRPLTQDVSKALEKLNIPVVLMDGTGGLLGEASGLLVPYEKRDEALAQSDMVILLGVPVDDRFDFGTKIPATAQVVAVNESKLQLTLNMEPHLVILGAPGRFLLEFAKRARRNERPLPHFSALPAPSSLTDRVAGALPLGPDDKVVCESAEMSLALRRFARPRAPFSIVGVSENIGSMARGAVAGFGAKQEGVIWVMCDAGSEMVSYKNERGIVTVVVASSADDRGLDPHMVLSSKDDPAAVLQKASTEAAGRYVRVLVVS